MKALTRSILTGFLGFILLIALGIITYQLLYAGRIFPGVSIEGFNMGGLYPSQVSKTLGENITYPQTGKVTLSYGENSWQVSPAQVGLFLDLDRSAQNAFSVGRQGNLITRLAEQFGAAYYGHPASLSTILDQRIAFTYLSNLAEQIDVPAADAGVSIQGTEVIVNSAVTGLHLDREATLQAITSQLNTLSDVRVPLVVKDIKPLVVDVGFQADQARVLLAEPFTLTLPSGQPDQQQSYTIQPAELAGMLAFGVDRSKGEPAYSLSLDPMKLTIYLSQLVGKLKLNPGEYPLHLQRFHPAAGGHPASRDRPRAGSGEKHPVNPGKGW